MADADKRLFSRSLKDLTLSIVSLDQYNKDGLWSTLTSVDLSESGIRFESPYAYNIGDRHIIRFAGKNNKLYDEQIEVIRVEEIVTNTHFIIGAKFLNSARQIIEKLSQ